MKKEYTIVALLEDVSVGETIIKWPLHVTILPWFSFYDYSAFLNQIHDIAQKTEPIEIRVGTRATWGVNTVNVIDYSIALHRLHEEILKIASAHGNLRKNGHEFIGRNYTPHITHQGRLFVHAGYDFTIKRIYVVESDMSLHVKTVVDSIVLTA